MKWINYHHLIYFKEVARLESVSKAAKSLRIGQPTLSTQIMQFEDTLGVKLFERKNNRLILTKFGSIVYEYAQQINNLGQELLELIDDKVFTKKIHLSIGALDSISKHFISDVIDLAHKKTGCFVSIFEDSILGLLKMLFEHKIEAIITDHDISNLGHKNLYVKKILTQKVSVFAAPKFKELKKNFPYSLDKCPLILPTHPSKMRSEVEYWFKKINISPRVIAETQDMALQKILAAKGDGIIFTPDLATKNYIKQKSLIKIGEIPAITITFFLIYAERIVHNPALEVILKQDYSKVKLGN